MDKYMTVNEVAELWGITPRRIQSLCAQGHIEGAVRFGRSWAVPRDTKRPADHREKQFRTYAQEKTGFTLIEMLVVIAIIAVLVAVVIPVVDSASEKSREATDMANVRSALGVVSMAAMTNDVGATYGGKPIYRSHEDTFSVRVPLKQQKPGWISERINIGGFTEADPNWWGNPKPNGSCQVLSDHGTIILNWSGEIALNKRWTYETVNGVKYLNAEYEKIPSDGYKASVICDLLDVKSGDLLNVKGFANVGGLDTDRFDYTYGVFVMDASNTNGKGQYEVLRDTKELALKNTDDHITICETNGNMKAAIQLFKFEKPKGKDSKPIDLTASEAAALSSLFSVK